MASDDLGGAVFETEAFGSAALLRGCFAQAATTKASVRATILAGRISMPAMVAPALPAVNDAMARGLNALECYGWYLAPTPAATSHTIISLPVHTVVRVEY
jgi:hypothetical protein